MNDLQNDGSNIKFAILADFVIQNAHHLELVCIDHLMDVRIRKKYREPPVNLLIYR